MSFESIVISSGHSTRCPGASDIIDEVTEATRVVDLLGRKLEKRGVVVATFHDLTSTTVDENLNRIVDFHNSCKRDLDVSVHFNAYEHTSKPMGTEVLHLTQEKLAGQVSAAIASVGFIDRGAKYRNDLFFLNNTDAPAILIEIAFVDSVADCDLYAETLDEICEAIAEVLGSEEGTRPRPTPPPADVLFHAKGKVSHFGGPDDTGVSASEDLAFFEDEEDIEDAPHLFLPYQPEGTSGLARRLNPYVSYFAARFDYDKIPKDEILQHVALVRAVKTGIALKAFPADWGPNANTGRVADLSPSLMENLGIETDDEVEIIFPYLD